MFILYWIFKIKTIIYIYNQTIFRFSFVFPGIPLKISRIYFFQKKKGAVKMKGILKLVTSYIRFHAKKTVRTAAGIAARLLHHHYLLCIFMDKWLFKFLRHNPLIKVRREHIPRHHALCGLGQGISVGELCNKRRVAVFFDARKELLAVLSETEHPRILAVSGFPVVFHVLFSDIQKDMEQAPADAGVGNIFCL